MRTRPAAKQMPKGLRLYLSDGQRTRCITLTKPLIAACSAAGLLIAGWLFGTTAYFVFSKEIREASHFYLIDKQRAYEDRIAALRRQIDTINARQFLDQVAFEQKLDDVRRRQQALEARQTQVTGLFEAVGERDIGFRLSPADNRRAETNRDDIVTGSSWTPLLVGRPRPSAALPADQAGPRDYASRSLAEIDQTVDRLWHDQDRLLTRIESGLAETIEQLAAVPQAIGAPLPKLDDGEGGLGGPFVELRGSDQPIAIEDQIARIERAVERVEALGRHVRRLPVRVPVKGSPRITSGYGSRIDPFLGRRALHTGIDFRASTGTPVLAAAGGRVTRAGRLGGYGNLIEIDHGGGYTTRYAHLSRIDVRRGQTVAPGDLIGAAGSTGRSTGPHLHYETRLRGRPVDPLPFVKAAELLPDGF